MKWLPLYPIAVAIWACLAISGPPDFLFSLQTTLFMGKLILGFLSLSGIVCIYLIYSYHTYHKVATKEEGI